MRPTPQETITGVRRILNEVVAPHLDDDYAQVRLREVCSVLAQIDWNDSTLALHHENEALADLLAAWRDWATADGARLAAFAAERTELDRVLADRHGAGGPEPFAAVNARHAALSKALVEISASLSAWARTDDEHRRLADPILAAMRRHYSTAALRARRARPDAAKA